MIEAEEGVEHIQESVGAYIGLVVGLMREVPGCCPFTNCKEMIPSQKANFVQGEVRISITKVRLSVGAYIAMALNRLKSKTCGEETERGKY